MAVLETIRTKIGWLITALIAIALLSFIVDFNSLSSVMQSSSNKFTVGKINGQKVSYKDFQEQVEYQTSVAELINGSKASSDEGMKNIRQAAWQHFIDQDLFLKNAKAAGIEVGKDELVDLTTGDMVSPVIMYDPIFGNNGNFDPQRVVDFVKNLEADASGNSRMYWNYIQDGVITQQFYAKYGSLFAASSLPNALTLANAIAENNTTATAKYVAVPFGFEQDSTIEVSTNEIKKYYNAHKNNFKQVANRDIEYVVFEVVPSEADLDAARKAVEEVYDEFATTDNVKNFLMRNSEKSLDNYYYKAGELVAAATGEVDDFVFGAANGVSPVFQNGNEFCAVKVVDTKNIPDSVFVRHILIQGDDNLADSLYNVVAKDPAQFTQLAALYSADKNPNVAAPGDLGWMTQTYMIPGMESVMTAKVNAPFLLNTQYGRHIVLVTKATKPILKKQVAVLQKTAVPSKQTMNEFYNKANSLATAAAGKLEVLREAAKEQGVYLRPMNVTEATAQYSGADRAKEVTRWIFEAKKGAASNVITVNQNFLFVVGVSEIHKEGYATINEAAANIKSVLYSQKLAEKKLAEVKEKIEGLTDIDKIAEALGQTVAVAENVTFDTFRGGQHEPALVGAIAGCEQGAVTAPVKGIRSIYVVNVTDRTTGEFYTEEDAKTMENQKVQYASRMIIPEMLESSNSVDNRERFY